MDEKRIAHLVAQMSIQLDLLNETEAALLYEVRPKVKAQLRQDIKETQEFYEKTSAECEKLKARSTSETAALLQTLAGQLEEMGAKLSAIAGGVTELRQTILARFDQNERTLLGVLLERLDDNTLSVTQAILAAAETQSVSQAEYAAELKAAIDGLAEVQRLTQEAGKPLPPEIAQAARILGNPDIEFKHRLKVMLPLIPFLLTYEREMNFNVKVDVNAAYDRFKRWIKGSGSPPNPP